MTNEEAKVFLDNLKICINEHPIVADWLVEIENRNDEPSSSEKPNNWEAQKRCDECIHFDRPYTKRDKDGMLIIGVECDGMDEPCDKWTDEPQTDCPWK